MKKNLFFIFLIISSFSFSQEKWTLEMCVKRAIDENISIKQSELDYVDAEISRKNAIGNFIPNVNVGSSHSWNVGLNQNITTGLLENITTQFSSMNLNLGIDVYNGLKNIKQLHLANLRILSSQFQLADMKEDISLLVANSYLQILFNKEFIKIQESQLELSKSEVERAKELVENGVIPKGDLYEFEANLAGVEKTLIDAQNNYALSKISLAQLLLLDDYQNFDIADKEYELQVSNILDKSPEEIFAVAVSTKNEIKLFETNLDIAKKNLELNKSFLQPRLSAFYSYSTRIAYSDRLVGTGEFQNVPIGFVENTNQRVLTPVQKTRIIGAESFSEQFDRNAGQNFGLSLSIPILNNFSVRSNVDRSKVNILRNENQLLQKKIRP
jgi:outer membrane protein